MPDKSVDKQIAAVAAEIAGRLSDLHGVPSGAAAAVQGDAPQPASALFNPMTWQTILTTVITGVRPILTQIVTQLVTSELAKLQAANTAQPEAPAGM